MSDAPSSPGADASSKPLPIGFAQFIVSLGSSALVHLGELAEPGSGRTEVDLVLARHTIDVLALLQEKTKGNLDYEEVRLLDALLFDLRQKFLEATAR